MEKNEYENFSEEMQGPVQTLLYLKGKRAKSAVENHFRRIDFESALRARYKKCFKISSFAANDYLLSKHS